MPYSSILNTNNNDHHFLDVSNNRFIHKINAKQSLQCSKEELYHSKKNTINGELLKNMDDYISVSFSSPLMHFDKKNSHQNKHISFTIEHDVVNEHSLIPKTYDVLSLPLHQHISDMSNAHDEWMSMKNVQLHHIYPLLITR